MPQHSKLPTRKMLVSGEKFRMGRAGIGGVCGDGDWGVNVESYGRETNFVAAGLVTELEGNFLSAERGVRLRGEGQAKDYFVFVHVQRSFGKAERVELAFGVRDFAG